MVAPALISGAFSLLGGILGRNQAKDDLATQRKLIAEQNEYNNPTNIRKRAEDAGFNPLSFIGPGVGLQTQTAQVNSGNYMGAAIADAGMAVADAMSKRADLGKLNKLEQANAKLASKVQSLTLRPKVAGVYAQRQSTPTIAAAVGGGNVGSGKTGASDPAVAGSVSGAVSGGLAVVASASGGVGPSLRPLPDSYPVDPRRLVDHKKVPSSSGFVVVDNPYIPYPVYIPSLDGDETVGPDYFTVPVAAALSGAMPFGRWLRNKTDAMGWTTDGVNYLTGEGRVRSPVPHRRFVKPPVYLNPRWNNSQRPMFGGGF